jgi:hypothetical protein
MMDALKEELRATTQNVREHASRSLRPPSPQCFFLTRCSVLDLSENTLEDGQGVLEVLRAMPNIRCLYLKGNPLVSKLPNYRKVGLSSAQCRTQAHGLSQSQAEGLNQALDFPPPLYIVNGLARRVALSGQVKPKLLYGSPLGTQLLERWGSQFTWVHMI